jgi:hypothetical protein
MQALASAIKRSDGLIRRTELIDALAAYRDAGREAVLQKFYQAVDRTNDPFIQIDLIAATGYAQDYLDNDPLIRAAEGLLADHRLPTFDDLHDELFEKRQKSLTELRRIRRDSKSKR